MGTPRWTYRKTMVKESRKNVWQVVDHRGKIAYFKYPKSKRRHQRLMIANEYVSISLAKSLGFPVAKLSPAVVQGPGQQTVRGYISRQVSADEVTTWKMLRNKIRQNPAVYVNRLGLLLQAAVFDVWILNKDRTDVNLILYRNDPRQKYDWYLIDFGSALLGSPHHSPFTRVKRMTHPQLFKPLRLPSGLTALLIEDQHNLQNMVDRIRRLPNRAIDKAINSIPRRLIRKAEKRLLKQLLVYRKQNIQPIMADVIEQLQRTQQALV